MATVNEFTQIYTWTAANNTRDYLHLHCERRGRKLSFQVESEGEYFLVSDLFKSITLLKFNEDVENDYLTESAHDFNTRWMASAMFLEENTYVGSEFETQSLFIAKRRTEERYQITVNSKRL